jgi:hypothetical protein
MVCLKGVVGSGVTSEDYVFEDLVSWELQVLLGAGLSTSVWRGHIGTRSRRKSKSSSLFGGPGISSLAFRSCSCGQSA